MTPSAMPARAAVVLLFLLFASAFGQNLSSGADLAALYRLRASLGLRARNWPRRSDPCSSWTGVGCRAGRVVSLNLTGLRRTRLGRLRPRFAVDAIQNLTRLAALNSTGFALPGPIPDWFGRSLPPTLATLVLDSAAVTGDIPDSLGGAAGISVLSLAGNLITGNIPSTLGQLGNLTFLDLSSNFLSGQLPPALGALANLQTLILSNNTLTGSIPPQLGNLSSLVNLDLSVNSLSGSLPDELKRLQNLKTLNLGTNSLTGNLSNSLFSGLPKLESVTLSRNNFSGSVPDSVWLSLPDLRFVDLAYNNLTGTLPDIVPANANVSGGVFNSSNNLYYGSIASGFGVLFARFDLVDLSGNYFEGAAPVVNGSKVVDIGSNCLRNGSNQRSVADCQQFYDERGVTYDNPNAAPPPLPPSSKSSGKSSTWKYILIGVLGGVALLVVLFLVIVLCIRKCGGRGTVRRESSPNAAPSAGGGAPSVAVASGAVPSGVSVSLAAVGDSFAYEQLVRATAEFSDKNLIKHGHSGDLYHGVLEGGIPVVVKRIDVQSVKREAYAVELDVFAKASHTRLVPFLGHCLENENEKLLVYKFMPHGDLSNALYRKPGQEEEGLQSLDWITRLKIATGVAEALCFLHHECTPPLVHRDVQASSILLDDKFEVRLGSLSEVCAQEGDGHQNVITRFLRLSQTSEPSVSGSSSATCAYDVYCLGKVLLELVTGKLGISGSNDPSTAEWLERTLPCINIYEKELVTKIVDPSLIIDEDLLEEVWAMAIVAKSCLNPKPTKRPLMKYILKALENPLKVVREENNVGSARLRATSSRGSWNAALFGSWRHSSSDIASVSGPPPPREDRSLKRSGTMRSQGSGGEHSFNNRRPPKEIFPEPSGARDIED